MSEAMSGVLFAALCVLTFSLTCITLRIGEISEEMKKIRRMLERRAGMTNEEAFEAIMQTIEKRHKESLTLHESMTKEELLEMLKRSYMEVLKDVESS